jgi:hypothetical protein
MRPATRVLLSSAIIVAAWSLAIEAQLPRKLRLPDRLPSLADPRAVSRR